MHAARLHPTLPGARRLMPRPTTSRGPDRQTCAEPRVLAREVVALLLRVALHLLGVGWSEDGRRGHTLAVDAVRQRCRRCLSRSGCQGGGARLRTGPKATASKVQGKLVHHGWWRRRSTTVRAPPLTAVHVHASLNCSSSEHDSAHDETSDAGSTYGGSGAPVFAAIASTARDASGLGAGGRRLRSSMAAILIEDWIASASASASASGSGSFALLCHKRKDTEKVDRKVCMVQRHGALRRDIKLSSPQNSSSRTLNRGKVGVVVACAPFRRDADLRPDPVDAAP